MAALPKVDSLGLRLAKSAGAERVSSVIRVSKDEPRYRDESTQGSVGRHGEKDAGRAVQSQSKRK